MSSKRKSKKLENARVQLLYLMGLCAILIIVLLIYIFIGFYNRNISESNRFSIYSRVDNIEERKKKDAEGVTTTGWLRVQGTNIDYPVIYAPGVDLGEIVEDFAWTNGNYDELNNITYIMGHNILNLSKTPYITDSTHKRFEQLMSFTYYDFAKKNQYFQYTVGGKNYIFKIYSVMYAYPESLETYNNSSYTKQKMSKYIKTTLDNSIFDYRTDVNYKDKIVSLVTCTRMFNDKKSFVVSGRLLRSGESTKLTNVHRTKNYLSVDEQLKGGNSNEKS